MTRLLSRTQAAHLLRKARRACARRSQRAGERIGLAHSAMGEHSAVARLKIDFLLDVHQYDSADALLARWLMRGSNERDEPLFRMRLARSLHEQGRIAQARAEIARVLEQRPHSCAAIMLAARIESDSGHTERALSLLILACIQRPRIRRLQIMLVRSLLESGLVNQAAEQIERIADAPPLLHAQVLRAQNRVLDAIELLQIALPAARSEQQRRDLICELIDVIEAAGDRLRMKNVLAANHDNDARTLLRTAEAFVWLGDFQSATEACGKINEMAAAPMLHRQARALGMIAAACGNIKRESPDAGEINHALYQPGSWMARVWLRAIFGRLAGARRVAAVSAADPSTSVLQPMLARAAPAFERALADSPQRSAMLRERWQQHLATCRDAMGHVVATAPAPDAAKTERAPDVPLQSTISRQAA